MSICRVPCTRPAGGRLHDRRGLVMMVLFLLLFGAAEAAEWTRPVAERGTARQTVPPGQTPSSRREPSRVRNQDEPPPTVPNRAPEIVTPPTRPPTHGDGGRG